MSNIEVGDIVKVVSAGEVLLYVPAVGGLA